MRVTKTTPDFRCDVFRLPVEVSTGDWSNSVSPRPAGSVFRPPDPSVPQWAFRGLAIISHQHAFNW